MKLAIISSEAVTSSAVAFAARRRGHQVAEFERPEALGSELPFQPAITVLIADASPADPSPAIAAISRHVPASAIFVCIEDARGAAPGLALRAGAHEVVAAPFNPHELVLRTEAWAAGHERGGITPDLVRLADLEIGLDQYVARKNGVSLPFTRLELRLLYCLCEHSPNIAPLERLLAFGWDALGDPESALIKTHISHIRRKLADAGGVPLEISSRQGVGYMLRPQIDPGP